MKRDLIRLSIVLAFGFLTLPAQAQRGARLAAPSSGGVRRSSGSIGSTSSRRNPNYAPFYGTPWNGNNLGFLTDGQSLAIQAAINPATQLRLAFAQRFLRNNRGWLGTGGYYLLDGGGAYIVPTDAGGPDEGAPPAGEEPPIVLQQAPLAPAAEPATEPQPPLPDEGEFTLVLKDGKQIQASAFTQTKGGTIIYIAPNGTRHTIMASDLDSTATQSINEEHGTPLQLHL